jgi:protein-L-isoaspartate O-methyltransferase
MEEWKMGDRTSGIIDDVLKDAFATVQRPLFIPAQIV